MTSAAIPHRTRIKICGITRLEDALSAAELGVDALGFVFYEKSPRYIAPEKAAEIIRQMPPFISAVGLFVNPSHTFLASLLAKCPIDILQFHGEETPEFCAIQDHRVLKAVPIETEADAARVSDYNCAVLLDARAPEGVYGGAGKAFDWKLVAGIEHEHALVLAGGLSPANVRDALKVRQWDAVDVSSGVEISPGLKDAALMREFVAAVRG